MIKKQLPRAAIMKITYSMIRGNKEVHLNGKTNLGNIRKEVSAIELKQMTVEKHTSQLYDLQ